MATNQTASIANATDIRDIAPPVEIADPWAWLWWTIAGVALVIAFVAFWNWRKKRAKLVPATPPVPAHVRAKLKLQDALTLIAQPKPFVVAVSDAERLYLEERFNFRAPERTTEEFLRELSATELLTKSQKESLGEFLTNCDLVKFAKYEPGETELRELHSSALRLVEETEPATTSPGSGQSPIADPQSEIANRKS